LLLVAVHPVTEGENIFAPPPTKTAEFEVKNLRKNAEEAKAEHLLFITSVIFRSNTMRLTLETYPTVLYQ